MTNEIEKQFELLKQSVSKEPLAVNTIHKTALLLELDEVIIWLLKNKIKLQKQLTLLKEYFNITVSVRSYRPFLKKHFQDEYEEFLKRTGRFRNKNNIQKNETTIKEDEDLNNPYFENKNKAKAAILNKFLKG